MVTLDKIHIEAPISALRGEKRYYDKKKPFLISVKTSPSYCNRVKIAFTAKILLDDYPQFINRETIRRCLEKVCEISSVDLDIDSILEEGKVTKCDFTKDIPIENMIGLNNDPQNFKRLIPLSLKNHQQYSWDAYRNGNIKIQKSVSVDSDGSKLRLTFYTKFNEIIRRGNDEFRTLLNDEQELRNYFYNKVRVEVNAYSSKQIKRWLDIRDNRISSVLNADGNPIKEAIKEVFVPVNITNRQLRLAEQDKIGLLKECDWDMGRIEAIVRERVGNHWTEKMPIYRELNLQFNPELNQIRQVNIADWV